MTTLEKLALGLAMGVTIIVAVAVFTPEAQASGDQDYGFDNSSNANANGTVLNYSPYNGTVLTGDLPQMSMSMESISCPTAQLGIAAVPTYNNSPYGDHSSGSIMATFSMPLDLNGAVGRCKDQQETLIRQAVLREREMKMMGDVNIINQCVRMHQAGTSLDPEHFPWAVKCVSVYRKHPHHHTTLH